ncbi:hypothetical protein [Geodermatophilus normandii]|uniref:hypothetical protein n=1 Tax=Geodermatophilus normandii TaxID=1137989 RepID=UPI000D715781|nr:hypothetical protein [Geodermatophilus normandii]
MAPGNREIPAHLKLAILARGRIAVPPASVSSLIEAARRRGATWPDRLRAPLEQLSSALPLTVELFLIQRAGMTADEIDEAITGYLMLRKAQEYPRSAAVEWQRVLVRSNEDRAALEQALALDVSRLFVRSRVQLDARTAAPQHLLLAYVYLPAGLQRYLRADPNLTSPLLPAPVFPTPTRLDKVPAMPPLEGRTDPHDELHLRAGPSAGTDPARPPAASLGVLAGHQGRVAILDKASTTDPDGSSRTWYQVKLEEPLSVSKDLVSKGNVQRKLLPAGQLAWLSAGGISIAAAPWDAFRRDLREWETTLPLMTPLAERITMLRQRSHKSNLPFDEVIGAAPGKIYQDKLAYQAGRWQMFLDYEAVIAPDGRWVDLQHLLVGLDALARPERPVTVTRALVASFDIGTNWAAATWSGDLGAGVADSLTEGTGAWDSYANPRTLADRIGFFLQSRAAEWDLLGDLDPWGIRPILAERNDVTSIDDLLSLYYEDLVEPVLDLSIQAPSPAGRRIAMTPSVRRRADAIRRFLAHYGFTFPPEVSNAAAPEDVWRDLVENFRVLETQPATRRIRREISQFTTIWLVRRNATTYLSTSKDDPVLNSTIDEATRYFLYWLEQEAIWHDVNTRENTQ